MFHVQVLRMTSLNIDMHDIIKKSVRYSERVSQGVNKSKLNSTARAMETFQIESCVRGHHIYKDIRNASSGEELTCSTLCKEYIFESSSLLITSTSNTHVTNLKSTRVYIKIAP